MSELRCTRKANVELDNLGTGETSSIGEGYGYFEAELVVGDDGFRESEVGEGEGGI